MKSQTQENNGSNLTDGLDGRPEASGDFSLQELFARFWRRKKALIFWSLAITVLVAVAGGWVSFHQERRETAILQFKLEFDGVRKREYPNGMKFSPLEIISTPVLNRVYAENRLEKYMRFPEFKKALDVVQTSGELRLLENQYAAILGNQNLGAQDRERIEAEFLEKKKSAMVPIYALRFAQKGPLAIPSTEIAKVLNDILKGWADYVTRTKGVLKYQVYVVSPNILDKDALYSEDYLVALDILNTAIERVNENIDDLSAIPGAKEITVGKEKMSLSDIRYRLADLKMFQLSYLTGLIREQGLSRNIRLSLGYIANMLLELDLKKIQAVSKKKIYDDSLKQYGLIGDGGRTGAYPPSSLGLGGESSGEIATKAPVFGTSFLNSLIELGQERSDTQFRQKITKDAIGEGIKKADLEIRISYYEDIRDKMEKANTGGKSGELQSAIAKRVNAVYTDACNRIEDAVDKINQVYLKISKKNLETSIGLYTVTKPVFVKTDKSVSTIRLMELMFLAWLGAEAVLFFGVLIASRSGRDKQVASGRGKVPSC